MTLERFTEIISNMQEISKYISDLYNFGIDIINNKMIELYDRNISELFREIYGKFGEDTISYFLYELTDEHKKEDYMWDKDGTPIRIDTIEQLYNYLENVGKE